MKMKGQSNIDNPEKLTTRRRKLATQGTQDEDKTQQKHNTTCVGHHYVQTNTNNAS